MDRSHASRRRTHLVVADRDEQRSESLLETLEDVRRPRSQILHVHPDTLAEALPEDLQASDALMVLLAVEGPEDIQRVRELREKAPTRRVFVVGLVDDGADDLVREAYGGGLNACIPSGPVDETVSRARKAAEFALTTVHL